MNAVLNSTVTFTCEATGVHLINFFVNGTPAVESHIMNRGFEQSQSTSNGITTSTLSVWAQEMNNNTSIYCETVPGGTRSTTAILKIQGIVKAKNFNLFLYRFIS